MAFPIRLAVVVAVVVPFEEPQSGFYPMLSLLVVSGHTSAEFQASLFSEHLLPQILKRYSFHERLHAIVRHPLNPSSLPPQLLPLTPPSRFLSPLSLLQLVCPMLSCHHSHCNSTAAQTLDQCVRSIPQGVAATRLQFLHLDLLGAVVVVAAADLHTRIVADSATADFAAAAADGSIPRGSPLDHRKRRTRARLPPPPTKARKRRALETSW